MTGYYITFTGGLLGSEVVIGPDEILTLNAPINDSQINEWTVSIAYDEFFDDVRHSDAVIEYEDDSGTREVDVRGPVDVVTHDDKQGQTTIRGTDELADLDGRGPRLPFFANGLAWKEIQRLWDTIPGWTGTVTEPAEEQSTTGRTIQLVDSDAGWQEIFDAEPTLPYRLDANANLSMHEVGHPVDTANQSATADTYLITDSDKSAEAGTASDSQYYKLYRPDSGEISATVTLDYDVPGEAFSAAVRWGFEDGVDTNVGDFDVNGIEVVLDGPALDEPTTVNSIRAIPSQNTDWYWLEGAVDDLPTLTAGDYTLTVSLVGDGFQDLSKSASHLKVDVIAALDDRWTYNLDHISAAESGSKNYLDGPGYYGVDGAPYALEPARSDLNITDAAFSVTTTGTYTLDSLQLRLTSDGQWLPADPSGTGNSVSATFERPGGEVGGRVALGGDETLSAQAQTPRFRYEPESVDTWEITVDETSQRVLVQEQYQGSWYEILQRIHEDGDLIFRLTPGTSQTAESFEPGGKTGTADWTRLGYNREFNVSDYANRVKVVGQLDESPAVEIRATTSPVESGETMEFTVAVQEQTRPSAVVEDQDEIDRVGVVPAYIETNDTTYGGLINSGRSRLRAGIADDDLAGTVTIVPERLKVGYSYPVPAFGGVSATLRRQTFRDAGQAQSRLEFRVDDDLASVISGLRGQIND